MREIYDRYGEELLKNSVPPDTPEDQATKKRPAIYKGGYKFTGNTDEIFERFFGTENPFTITLDCK